MDMNCPEFAFSANILSNDLAVSWSRSNLTQQAGSVYWVYAPPDCNHSLMIVISMSVSWSEAVVYYGLAQSWGMKAGFKAYLWLPVGEGCLVAPVSYWAQSGQHTVTSDIEFILEIHKFCYLLCDLQL